MKSINHFCLFSILALFCLVTNAQNPKDQEELKKCIDIGYIEDHDNLPGRIVITKITNEYNKEVTVLLTNEYSPDTYILKPIKIAALQQREFPAGVVCNRVQAYVKSDSSITDIYYKPKTKEQN